jgi:hypothetical protein
MRTKRQAEKNILKLQRATKIVRNDLIKFWERIRLDRGERSFCGCFYMEMFALRCSLMELGK